MTENAKPVSASVVSRQLRAAGFRPIAPETKYRREGMYVERSVLGEVHIGFACDMVSSRVGNLAEDVFEVLEDLGYRVRGEATPYYYSLYVSR